MYIRNYIFNIAQFIYFYEDVQNFVQSDKKVSLLYSTIFPEVFRSREDEKSSLSLYSISSTFLGSSENDRDERGYLHT